MRERIIFDIGYLETGYDQLFNQLVAFDADQSHFRPYAKCLTAKKDALSYVEIQKNV